MPRSLSTPTRTTNSLRAYQVLESRVEAVTKEMNRVEGRITQLTSQLKEDFDCEDIKQARKKLKSMNKSMANLEDTLGREIDKFNDKWGDQLDAY